ncbi:hypothetical protein DH2020_024747 [Rehmannia glutinosa]|uniref:Uncharacterized protein n=1 Tax=Rehmannia glutinosa TaxID=99300 RepID=A0ABR0W2H0_REHGL
MTINSENLAGRRSDFMQFILDAQFLVEIARSGGYLSDNVINVSTNIISRLEESFISAGLSPLRDMNDGEWPANAATRALKKLQELHEKENATTSTQDSLPYVSSDIQFEDEGIESVNNPVIVNAQDSDSNTQASITEGTPIEENVDLEERHTVYCNRELYGEVEEKI